MTDTNTLDVSALVSSYVRNARAYHRDYMSARHTLRHILHTGGMRTAQSPYARALRQQCTNARRNRNSALFYARGAKLLND